MDRFDHTYENHVNILVNRTAIATVLHRICEVRVHLSEP